MALEKLERIFIKNNGECSKIVKEGVKEAYQKHINPSIENKFSTLSKQLADKEATKVFSANLQQLLLAPPVGNKRIME